MTSLHSKVVWLHEHPFMEKLNQPDGLRKLLSCYWVQHHGNRNNWHTLSQLQITVHAKVHTFSAQCHIDLCATHRERELYFNPPAWMLTLSHECYLAHSRPTWKQQTTATAGCINHSRPTKRASQTKSLQPMRSPSRICCVSLLSVTLPLSNHQELDPLYMRACTHAQPFSRGLGTLRHLFMCLNPGMKIHGRCGKNWLEP